MTGTSMCPHCGQDVAVEDSLTFTHDWPPMTRQVCPGSGQIPRCAESDARPLWNGKPNTRFAGSGYDTDALYLDLLGARERICRAQTHVPRHWVSDLQAAADFIDQAGSALCPEQWSRFDQPAEEA